MAIIIIFVCRMVLKKAFIICLFDVVEIGMVGLMSLGSFSFYIFIEEFV